MDKEKKGNVTGEDRMVWLKKVYRYSLPEPWRRSIRRWLKKCRKINKQSARTVHPIPALLFEAKNLLEKWQLEPALDVVENIIKIEPTHRRALQLQATILGHLGRKDESLKVSRRVIKLYPVDVPSRRHIRALGYLPPPASRQIALEHASKYSFDPSVCIDCALFLYDAEFFDDAIEMCQLGLVAASSTKKRGVRLAKAIQNLKLHKAMALEAKSEYERAAQLFQDLLPDQYVGRTAAAGFARCLLEMGWPGRAEEVLKASNAGSDDLQPFTPLTLDVLQAQGKIRKSYQLYRKRPLSQVMAKAFEKTASPEELNIAHSECRHKNALIVSEGGPGDELRFSTLYSDLTRSFSQVTLTCDPRLTSVMSRNFPSISFIPVPRLRREFVADISDRTQIPDARLFQCVSDKVMQLAKTADIACSVLDTLADLRPGLDAFNIPSAPLCPKDDLREMWSQQFSFNGKYRIGLAWRSMLQSVARNRHYLTIDQLLPLQQLSDCEFWLLQPNATEEEIAGLREFLDIRVPAGLDLIDDFEGQIAFTSSLDCVFSPFITTGELAGACGIPTVLISTTQNTAWRRRADGRDIWHASAKIVTASQVGYKQNAVQEAVYVIRELLKDQALYKQQANLGIKSSSVLPAP